MAKTIQDVLPPSTKRLLPNDLLITILYKRGVTIKDIFGKFYELEEQANARDDELFGNDEDGQHGKPKGRPRLTAGDAQLATGINFKPGVRQPF